MTNNAIWKIKLIFKKRIKKVGCMVVQESNRVLQELSLLVCSVVKCSARVMSKIRYTVYVSACASYHACAYVGPATHACIEAIIYLYTWDLSLGIETLEEVRRKG